MGPGAVEQQQVDVEEQQVRDSRDDHEGHHAGQQVTEHTDLPPEEERRSPPATPLAPGVGGRRAGLPRPGLSSEAFPLAAPAPASPAPTTARAGDTYIGQSPVSYQLPGVDGGDRKHQQVSANTHVLDAGKTEGRDANMGPPHGEDVGAASGPWTQLTRLHRRRPRPSAPATATSSGRRAWGAKRRRELGTVPERSPQGAETSAAHWPHQLQGQGEAAFIAQNIHLRGHVLPSRNVAPISLSHRKTRTCL